MCIYEDCETPHKMYPKSDELLKHMLSQHGVDHWVCDYCASKSEADQYFVFKHIEDWENHMKAKHSASFLPSKLSSLAKVSKRAMLEPLACPLCEYMAEHPQSTLDDHITKHLYGFALRCLPWSTGGNDLDSVNAKSADASNSSELNDKDDEDEDSASLVVDETIMPTRLYEIFKAIISQFFGPSQTEHGRLWPYDDHTRERLGSIDEECLKILSVAESWAKDQADQLTYQQSQEYRLPLADLHSPAGLVSPHDHGRVSSKFWNYTLDPSSSFPTPEQRALEHWRSHLLKATYILYQTAFGWGEKRPGANAFELYCNRATSPLRAKIKDHSIDIKEAFRQGWGDLSNSQRGEYERMFEIEIKNYEDFTTQANQHAEAMLEVELNALEIKNESPLSKTALSPQISHYTSEEGLSQQLSDAIDDTRLAMEVPEETGFVPRRQLVRIMNVVSVAKELSRIEQSFKTRIRFWRSTPTPRTIDEEAQIICASSSPETALMNQELMSKSFRKVFATLLLIEQPSTIRKFIEEGVCDADLPLRKVPRRGRDFSMCRKDTPDVSLQCFEGWNRTSLVQFEQLQWKMVAPFFSLDEESHMVHYPLPDGAILPFTYRERTHSGAHGVVFKVKIHPEHHNFINHKVSPPVAAN
jgi:hypothetical protein